MFAHVAYAQQLSGDYYYTDNGNGTVTITEYTGSGPAVTIPGTINGEPVTAIGDFFEAHTFLYGNGDNRIASITSFTIPDSVTSIGYEAFDGFYNMTNISLGNGVTYIGYGALSGCGLTSLTIPNSVTAFGDYAFSNCNSLTSVTIPNSVTAIADSLFFECTGLTSVSLPTSVTSIGIQTFYGCTSLSNITLPNSVTTIGAGAFYECTALTNVNLGSGVTSIGGGQYFGAFQGCTALSSISTIPAGVTSIGPNAFTGTQLTQINVDPANPDYTSSNGVLFNKSMTQLIEYPNGNTQATYTVPNGVSSILLYAFSGCRSLTSVIIPTSITTIGDDAFSSCTNLTSAYFQGNAPSSFGNSVFNGTASNFAVYYYPNSTGFSTPKWMGYNASVNDPAITYTNNGTTITITGYTGSGGALTIPTMINGEPVAIGNAAFSGLTSLTSVNIPSGVTSIGANAFQGCTSLTTVTIGSGITSIGAYGFQGCTSLTTLTIGGSVTSIGADAFQGCIGLTSVSFPPEVTSIGDSAFSGCTRLASAYFQGNAPSSFGNNVFYGTASNFAIYYYPNSTGFSTPSWNGYQTVDLIPPSSIPTMPLWALILLGLLVFLLAAPSLSLKKTACMNNHGHL